MMPVALTWMWVSLAVIVRRLHDLDHGARPPFLFIPLFGLISWSYTAWSYTPYTTFLILFTDHHHPFIISLSVGLKPGNPLINRYGQPPGHRVSQLRE